VSNALKSVPGVRTAVVDFGKKEALVTVEKKALDRKALIAAVEKLGYQCSVKADAAP